jgi:2-phosphosulfolactate phosphatase
LLVGELGGHRPEGFHVQNSPSAIEARDDPERPAVLLSTSGTRLLHEATSAGAVYAACLRNLTAQVVHLAAHHSHVAVIGAGSKGEFREEDQLACARVAAGLLDMGYRARDARTLEIVERWQGAPVEACAVGPSAEYLQRTGQADDLEFVVTHIDDLNGVFLFEEGELRRVPG